MAFIVGSLAGMLKGAPVGAAWDGYPMGAPRNKELAMTGEEAAACTWAAVAVVPVDVAAGSLCSTNFDQMHRTSFHNFT